ncbi:hypothetical protein LRD69_18430 [Streptomyces sp. JH14]|uniref:hypothetical protein n=1 Tax=Streptomyces sp. JH14 TaxID=2793630 RepID=UPI0023F953B8|nr:hypothetical protein [Streptomyces sp. JH14]MDF6044074.1 hypothetical protein [Streptomyces sp. JH14]
MSRERPACGDSGPAGERSCADEFLAHHGRRPRRVTPDWLTEELTQLSLTMLGTP